MDDGTLKGVRKHRITFNVTASRKGRGDVCKVIVLGMVAGVYSVFKMADIVYLIDCIGVQRNRNWITLSTGLWCSDWGVWTVAS